MHGKLWIGKSHVHVLHQIIQARILLKAQGRDILSINQSTDNLSEHSMLASHIHAGTEPLQSLFVNDFSSFSMQWMFTPAACMHLVFMQSFQSWLGS